jgi:hypothetical protein
MRSPPMWNMTLMHVPMIALPQQLLLVVDDIHCSRPRW